MTQTRTKQEAVIEGLTALAVSKYSQPKGNRELIAPGEYDVDEVVRIVGTVKVGEDYDQNIVADLPMKKLVMALASQVSQVRLAKMLSPEALEKISDKEADEFSKRIQTEWQKLADSTEKTCKGKVTSKLVVTSVD